MLETSIGAMSRVRSSAAQTRSENKPGEDRLLSPVWPQHGSIGLTRLSAEYSFQVPILKDIPLRIHPGQKVGICGPSGSGKSLVIAIPFRMLEITLAEFW